MNSSDFRSGFGPVGGAEFLPAQSPLCQCQLGSIFFGIARIINFNAIAGYKKTAQANIDTNYIFNSWLSRYLKAALVRVMDWR